MSVIWRFSLLYHFTCSSFYFLNVYHIHLCIFKLSLNFFCHTFFVYNLARSGIQRTRNLLVSIRKLPNHDFLDKNPHSKNRLLSSNLYNSYKTCFFMLLRLLGKQNAFPLPVFSIFFLFTTSPEYPGKSGNILQNITPNTIRSFRDSVPVRKMHGCYSRMHKNFEQHSILMQAMQAITISR